MLYKCKASAYYRDSSRIQTGCLMIFIGCYINLLNYIHFFDVYLISPKSNQVAHPDSGMLDETLIVWFTQLAPWPGRSASTIGLQLSFRLTVMISKNTVDAVQCIFLWLLCPSSYVTIVVLCILQALGHNNYCAKGFAQWAFICIIL